MKGFKRKVNLSNKGKPFEEENARSIAIFAKGWWERIPDVQDYMGKSCPSCKAPIAVCSNCGHRLPTIGMMPGKRMADFHGLVEGLYWLLECKSTQWKNGFPCMNMKEHQINSLMKNVMAGGPHNNSVSWVGLCNRSDPHKPIAYYLTIQQYCNIGLKKYLIKWSDIEKVAVKRPRLPRSGEPIYDLSFMFYKQE